MVGQPCFEMKIASFLSLKFHSDEGPEQFKISLSYVDFYFFANRT